VISKRADGQGVHHFVGHDDPVKGLSPGERNPFDPFAQVLRAARPAVSAWTSRSGGAGLENQIAFGRLFQLDSADRGQCAGSGAQFEQASSPVQARAFVDLAGQARANSGPAPARSRNLRRAELVQAVDVVAQAGFVQRHRHVAIKRQRPIPFDRLDDPGAQLSAQASSSAGGSGSDNEGSRDDIEGKRRIRTSGDCNRRGAPDRGDHCRDAASAGPQCRDPLSWFGSMLIAGRDPELNAGIVRPLSCSEDLAEPERRADCSGRAGPFGRIDVLINNASAFYPTPVGEATQAHWDELMASNLRAPVLSLPGLCAPPGAARRSHRQSGRYSRPGADEPPSDLRARPRPDW
jgi:hypothetical protein